MCESRTEAMQNVLNSLAAVIHKSKRNAAGNSKKVVQPLNSNVTDREAGVRTTPTTPGKLNVKPDPHFAYISVFCILLVFSSLLLFLRFSECFPVISGFRIEVHIKIHYHFSAFFLIVVCGPLQLRFSPGSKL